MDGPQPVIFDPAVLTIFTQIEQLQLPAHHKLYSFLKLCQGYVQSHLTKIQQLHHVERYNLINWLSAQNGLRWTSTCRHGNDQIISPPSTNTTQRQPIKLPLSNCTTPNLQDPAIVLSTCGYTCDLSSQLYQHHHLEITPDWTPIGEGGAGQGGSGNEKRVVGDRSPSLFAGSSRKLRTRTPQNITPPFSPTSPSTHHQQQQRQQHTHPVPKSTSTPLSLWYSTSYVTTIHSFPPIASFLSTITSLWWVRALMAKINISIRSLLVYQICSLCIHIIDLYQTDFHLLLSQRQHLQQEQERRKNLMPLMFQENAMEDELDHVTMLIDESSSFHDPATTSGGYALSGDDDIGHHIASHPLSPFHTTTTTTTTPLHVKRGIGVDPTSSLSPTHIHSIASPTLTEQRRLDQRASLFRFPGETSPPQISQSPPQPSVGDEDVAVEDNQTKPDVSQDPIPEQSSEQPEADTKQAQPRGKRAFIRSLFRRKHKEPSNDDQPPSQPSQGHDAQHDTSSLQESTSATDTTQSTKSSSTTTIDPSSISTSTPLPSDTPDTPGTATSHASPLSPSEAQLDIDNTIIHLPNNHRVTGILDQQYALHTRESLRVQSTGILQIASVFAIEMDWMNYLPSTRHEIEQFLWSLDGEFPSLLSPSKNKPSSSSSSSNMSSLTSPEAASNHNDKMMHSSNSNVSSSSSTATATHHGEDGKSTISGSSVAPTSGSSDGSISTTTTTTTASAIPTFAVTPSVRTTLRASFNLKHFYNIIYHPSSLSIPSPSQSGSLYHSNQAIGHGSMGETTGATPSPNFFVTASSFTNVLCLAPILQTYRQCLNTSTNLHDVLTRQARGKHAEYTHAFSKEPHIQQIHHILERYNASFNDGPMPLSRGPGLMPGAPYGGLDAGLGMSSSSGAVASAIASTGSINSSTLPSSLTSNSNSNTINGNGNNNNNNNNNNANNPGNNTFSSVPATPRLSRKAFKEMEKQHEEMIAKELELLNSQYCCLERQIDYELTYAANHHGHSKEGESVFIFTGLPPTASRSHKTRWLLDFPGNSSSSGGDDSSRALNKSDSRNNLTHGTSSTPSQPHTQSHSHHGPTPPFHELRTVREIQPLENIVYYRLFYPRRLSSSLHSSTSLSLPNLGSLRLGNCIPSKAIMLRAREHFNHCSMMYSLSIPSQIASLLGLPTLTDRSHTIRQKQHQQATAAAALVGESKKRSSLGPRSVIRSSSFSTLPDHSSTSGTNTNNNTNNTDDGSNPNSNGISIAPNPHLPSLHTDPGPPANCHPHIPLEWDLLNPSSQTNYVDQKTHTIYTYISPMIDMGYSSVDVLPYLLATPAYASKLLSIQQCFTAPVFEFNAGDLFNQLQTIPADLSKVILLSAKTLPQHLHIPLQIAIHRAVYNDAYPLIQYIAQGGCLNHIYSTKLAYFNEIRKGWDDYLQQYKQLSGEIRDTFDAVVKSSTLQPSPSSLEPIDEQEHGKSHPSLHDRSNTSGHGHERGRGREHQSDYDGVDGYDQINHDIGGIDDSDDALHITPQFTPGDDDMLLEIGNTVSSNALRADNSSPNLFGNSYQRMPRLSQSIDIPGKTARGIGDTNGSNRMDHVTGASDIAFSTQSSNHSHLKQHQHHHQEQQTQHHHQSPPPSQQQQHPQLPNISSILPSKLPPPDILDSFQSDHGLDKLIAIQEKDASYRKQRVWLSTITLQQFDAEKETIPLHHPLLQEKYNLPHVPYIHCVNILKILHTSQQFLTTRHLESNSLENDLYEDLITSSQSLFGTGNTTPRTPHSSNSRHPDPSSTKPLPSYFVASSFTLPSVTAHFYTAHVINLALAFQKDTYNSTLASQTALSLYNQLLSPPLPSLPLCVTSPWDILTVVVATVRCLHIQVVTYMKVYQMLKDTPVIIFSDHTDDDLFGNHSSDDEHGTDGGGGGLFGQTAPKTRGSRQRASRVKGIFDSSSDDDDESDSDGNGNNDTEIGSSLPSVHSTDLATSHQQSELTEVATPTITSIATTETKETKETETTETTETSAITTTATATGSFSKTSILIDSHSDDDDDALFGNPLSKMTSPTLELFGRRSKTTTGQGRTPSNALELLQAINQLTARDPTTLSSSERNTLEKYEFHFQQALERCDTDLSGVTPPPVSADTLFPLVIYITAQACLTCPFLVLELLTHLPAMALERGESGMMYSLFVSAVEYLSQFDQSQIVDHFSAHGSGGVSTGSGTHPTQQGNEAWEQAKQRARAGSNTMFTSMLPPSAPTPVPSSSSASTTPSPFTAFPPNDYPLQQQHQDTSTPPVSLGSEGESLLQSSIPRDPNTPHTLSGLGLLSKSYHTHNDTHHAHHASSHASHTNNQSLFHNSSYHPGHPSQQHEYSLTPSPSHIPTLSRTPLGSSDTAQSGGHSRDPPTASQPQQVSLQQQQHPLTAFDEPSQQPPPKHDAHVASTPSDSSQSLSSSNSNSKSSHEPVIQSPDFRPLPIATAPATDTDEEQPSLLSLSLTTAAAAAAAAATTTTTAAAATTISSSSAGHDTLISSHNPSNPHFTFTRTLTNHNQTFQPSTPAAASPRDAMMDYLRSAGNSIGSFTSTGFSWNDMRASFGAGSPLATSTGFTPEYASMATSLMLGGDSFLNQSSYLQAMQQQQQSQEQHSFDPQQHPLAQALVPRLAKLHALQASASSLFAPRPIFSQEDFSVFEKADLPPIMMDAPSSSSSLISSSASGSHNTSSIPTVPQPLVYIATHESYASSRASISHTPSRETLTSTASVGSYANPSLSPSPSPSPYPHSQSQQSVSSHNNTRPHYNGGSLPPTTTPPRAVASIPIIGESQYEQTDLSINTVEASKIYPIPNTSSLDSVSSITCDEDDDDDDGGGDNGGDEDNDGTA